MAKIDLEHLRAEYSKMTNPQSGGNSDFLEKFLQLQEGTTPVRILPGSGEHQFYAETKLHRVTQPDGNNKNYHCRKVHGEECPLCDLYYGLWKTGKAEDETLARKIKPRARYYSNVLVREGDEEGQVKVLSYGVKLYQKIVGTILDEDYGDITDPETGHDFKIIKVMEDGWPKYDQSGPRPKSSKLGSAKQVAEIMETMHDIHELVRLETYEDVKAAVDMLVGIPTGTPNPSTEVDDDEYLNKMKS